MKMTAEGLALIKRFEGFRGRAYRCPSGTWTIGYGHTAQAGPPAVSEGMEISRGAANDILARDVAMFAKEVERALRVSLPDQQFSALVSFAYNVGTGSFASSSVLKAINAGDFAAVSRRLQLWNRASGRVLPGLVKRRAAEAELFLGGGAEPAEPGAVTASQGKPLTRSTTALAAAISMLAATLSAVFRTGGSWILPLVFLAVVAAAGAWIVRERRRKALEEGH